MVAPAPQPDERPPPQPQHYDIAKTIITIHFEEVASDPRLDLRSLTNALEPDEVHLRGMNMEIKTARSKTQMKKLLVRQLLRMSRIVVKGCDVRLYPKAAAQRRLPPSLGSRSARRRGRRRTGGRRVRRRQKLRRARSPLPL